MKRQRRTSRGMPPVYRDVHPDRCPVELYQEDGTIGIRADLPAPVVECLDGLARQEKVSFQTFVSRAVIDIIDRACWGKEGAQ